MYLARVSEKDETRRGIAYSSSGGGGGGEVEGVRLGSPLLVVFVVRGSTLFGADLRAGEDLRRLLTSGVRAGGV
jgi:hypothetical protein